jgi:DNA-directed RNA polymerase subunit H
MEDRAVEVLQVMLSRRGLKTDLERLTPDNLERANAYKIGDVLVIFSQKEKGLLERDIDKLTEFASKMEMKQGLIIVTMSPPSENVEKVVKALAKQRIQLFHIRQLQFDITTHRMVSPHFIFDENFKKQHPDITKEYETRKITKPEEQLPSIDSQDPMAKWIGAIPGDIVYVQRPSDTAGDADFWRYVVEDANVA